MTFAFATRSVFLATFDLLAACSAGSETSSAHQAATGPALSAKEQSFLLSALQGANVDLTDPVEPRAGFTYAAVVTVRHYTGMSTDYTDASAAAINLACAVPSVDWGVSLTHFYLAHDIVKTPLRIADGLVALPQAPGLGVEVDEDAVARFTVHG